MSEIQNQFEEVYARFQQIDWHDSEFLNLHLLKDSENSKCDLWLEINLNISFSKGGYNQVKTNVIFKECRIVQIDLDLLGVIMCSGAIGDAICYKDAAQLEKEVRNKIIQFDLLEKENPLANCLGFYIEMINPGGEIIIFAKDFELKAA